LDIPLEIHHIDGNPKNHKLGNLQILCPNCHDQTDNYCGKNKTSVLKKNKIKFKKLKIKKKYYCKCGVEIKKQSKSCINCYHKKTRKIKRPNKKILMRELKNSNYTQIGKKYGVSDNSIRKWVIYYNKD